MLFLFIIGLLILFFYSLVRISSSTKEAYDKALEEQFHIKIDRVNDTITACETKD